MIRWYDYALAVLAADLMLSFSLAALAAPSLLYSTLFGTLAGTVYTLWTVDYCAFRLKQETK
jgi:hypothetical protein